MCLIWLARNKGTSHIALSMLISCEITLNIGCLSGLSLVKELRNFRLTNFVGGGEISYQILFQFCFFPFPLIGEDSLWPYFDLFS